MKTKFESEEMNMYTFLDLLVVVFMVLTALSLLSVLLMFLVRNEKVKRICLIVTGVLGTYVGTVSVRIMWLAAPVQMWMGILLSLVSVAAVVLELVAKDNAKLHKIARIMAAASLAVGIINAVY